MKTLFPFLLTQLIGFSVGAYFVGIHSDVVFWIWLLTGLVGFVLTFVVSSSRLVHSGAIDYLTRLSITMIAASIFWLLIIALCAMMQLTKDSMLIVSMFFLWLPALIFWSSGWCALLVLGM